MLVLLLGWLSLAGLVVWVTVNCVVYSWVVGLCFVVFGWVVGYL